MKTEHEGPIRLMIRVFVRDVMVSEERVDVRPDLDDADRVPALIQGLAERHAAMLMEVPGMVEIEFLDEPDANTRFFRIGTDPSRMVLPIAITPEGDVQ